MGPEGIDRHWETGKQKIGNENGEISPTAKTRLVLASISCLGVVAGEKVDGVLVQFEQFSKQSNAHATLLEFSFVSMCVFGGAVVERENKFFSREVKYRAAPLCLQRMEQRTPVVIIDFGSIFRARPKQ